MSERRTPERKSKSASRRKSSPRSAAGRKGKEQEAKSGTGPIGAEQIELLARAAREVDGYMPVPEVLYDEDGNELPRWRVRLDIDADPPVSHGLDIYGPLVLGRADGESEDEAFFDLTAYDAEARGVSRRHLELRPTPHGLFVVDLGSTNGTHKNGVPLKPNSPTSLGSYDTLSLGLLHITVDIVDAPHQEADWYARQATLGQALTEMAKTITTRLKVEDVLNAVVDYAIGLTDAQEAALWLLQPEMRELRLEAARGLEPEFIKSLTLPVTGSIAGEAILTGKPQLRTRSELGGKIAIAGEYVVDSIIFVPLALGGLSLGVLSVSNRTPGHDFTERDQRVLASLADFAAIALQNSRTLQATDEALRASLRAQREATARALESTRLKSEFLATISHELRSPLHTINGFSQMALRGSFGELTPGLRDALERIHNNGKQLLEMVDDLLDTLRIEARELELTHEEFSPRKLVKEVVRNQMPIAKEKGLLLSWASDPDVPDTLVGDPGRVRQVLLNLVGNALKFTDKGGVSVQIRTIGTHMWAVSVADTGIGIAPEDQEAIFERFRQVDQSSTRKHGGVGLGLAISHDLADIMGGDLRVSSEGIPGKGSTFTMTLPLILPGQEPSPLTVADDTLKLGSKARGSRQASGGETRPSSTERQADAS